MLQQGPGVSCLFGRATGKELWRVNREKAGTSWCTPLVWQNHQRTEVIASGQKLMTSHDPVTGEELWRVAGIDVPSTSSITANPGAIFFGYRAPIYCRSAIRSWRWIRWRFVSPGWQVRHQGAALDQAERCSWHADTTRSRRLLIRAQQQRALLPRYANRRRAL